MDGRTPRRPAATRSLDEHACESSRSWWDRAQDVWFAPKRFESTTRYERLGVLLIKRYVPTGGDFFIRRYGIRIAEIRGNLDALMRYERLTRRLEAIHELVFVAFLGWSLWRAVTRQTTLLELGVAIVVYLVLILSPAMLQRYNRLRVSPIIQRMAVSPLQSGQGGVSAAETPVPAGPPSGQEGDRARGSPGSGDDATPMTG